MRKDVRIGLSIGGVLLAVLIVYLLVPKDNNSNRNKGQEVAQNGGGDASGQGGGLADQTSLANAGAAPNPGQPAGNGGGSPAEPGAQPQPGTTVAGAGATDNGAAPGAPTGEAAQAGDTNKGFDWASILETGMPKNLVATTPPRDPFEDAKKVNGNGGTGNSDALDARQAVGTPEDKIPWGTPGAVTQPPAGGNTTGRVSGTDARPQAAKPGEHVVQPHETFSTIALMLYGDARYFKELQKANPNVDERRLRPGMVIKVPDAATIKAGTSGVSSASPGAAPAKAAEPAVDPSREYRVAPGDSLEKISTKLYGKPTKKDALYDANREKIGADPHKIKVGMVLKLPEPPTVNAGATR
jgi:nucleoid-associated protein YgaU